MKKYSIVLMSLLVFTLIVSACSSGKGGNKGTGNKGGANRPPTETTSEPPAEEDITQKKVKISIYYPTPDLVEARALEDDKIRRFNEVYPNVEIVKSDWQYNPNEIGIKMAANEAPTLFNTYATEGK